MSDKNPKHPLKKKKAAAKINIADPAAVEDSGYFLIYGKLKVSFFTNKKRYITIIPGRKDEVYERITLWHCGTAREDT